MVFARRITFLALATVICALLAFGAAPATQRAATSQPSAIQYHEEVRVNPPLHLHVVKVDLTNPSVQLKVARGGDDPDGDGPWQTKLDTVRNIAAKEKLDVAVNASFFTGKDAMNVFGRQVPYFTGNWGMVTGWAMSDGVLWACQPSAAALVVDAKGRVSIGRFGKLPADAQQVVSASEQIVNHGRNSGTSKDRAPRTSIGVDRAGKTLILLVIDGRRDDYSVGVTLAELADEMIRLGAWDAINLDGGGSSTMVMRDAAEQKYALKNRPSDGHDFSIPLSIERPVANVFGVVMRGNPATQP